MVLLGSLTDDVIPLGLLRSLRTVLLQPLVEQTSRLLDAQLQLGALEVPAAVFEAERPRGVPNPELEAAHDSSRPSPSIVIEHGLGFSPVGESVLHVPVLELPLGQKHSSSG